MLKVLLVDDTPEDATALAVALTRIDGVEVSRATLEDLPRCSADLVLIGGAALRRLHAELEETKARLAERKLVERAKGILMKHRHMDEEEAFAAIRTLAMQRGIRLGEAARQVIDIAAMLG